MRRIFILICLICLGSFLIWYSHGEKLQDLKKLGLNTNAPSLKSSQSVKVDLNFGKIPLYFIANQGQVNQKARFYAKASRYTLWITNEGLVFDSAKRSEVRKQKSGGDIRTLFQRANDSTLQRQYQRDVSRLMFLGANKNREVIPINETKLKVNYFKGNDPSKWVGDIPTSQAVLYKNLYKNIDLKVYGIEKQIEYDWIVRPGGNPEDIRFEYKNVKSTRVDKEGNLVIKTKFGELIHEKPVSYQKIKAKLKIKKAKVEADFIKISKNIYGFEVDEYDKSKTLIVDPVILAYSTYLGGSDGDSGLGVALDGNGYTYIVGSTLSIDFPLLHQYQVDQPGLDAFISIFDTTKNGTASLKYSTYLGGNGSDMGYGIAVDSNNYIYVTGETQSDDFPIRNPFLTNLNGLCDAFITKIDPKAKGISSLIYSSYLGGSYVDYASGIAVDSNENAYVTGSTDSLDFPILNELLAHPGGIYTNGFVTRIDTNKSGVECLIYSTYLGGSDWDDFSYAIAVDNNANLYVTGAAGSSDFPIKNQYQNNDPHSGDAFLTRIDTNQTGATSLIYSTYICGTGWEKGYGIDVDNYGNTYITGNTDSSDFPLKNQFQSTPGAGGGNDAFVVKIDTNQSGVSSLIYSTYLGGNEDDEGHAIAADNYANAYITGITRSSDFPVKKKFQNYQASYDTFVTKICTSAIGSNSLIYSTYLGGDSSEAGKGIVVDVYGNAYIVGWTRSNDFPTKNQYQLPPGYYNSGAFLTQLVFPVIEITSPNGGEVWKPGTIQNITWDCVGLSHNLIIVLRQNGTDVALIDKNINPDLGTYSWTVGDCIQGTVSAGTNCRIIVKEKQTTVADKSDGSFTILPSLIITSPNGGEIWQIGDMENITWNASLLPGDLIKIVLLKTNGTAILGIANNLDPTTGTFAWDIPSELPARDYLIKIKVKNKAISDKSDSTFTLSL